MHAEKGGTLCWEGIPWYLLGSEETPHAKLITQMFHKRPIIANFTGCSKNWAGTAGRAPHTKDDTIPVVVTDKRIQSNICSAICPHAGIRPVLFPMQELAKAPKGFAARNATGGNTYAGLHFRT